MERHRLHTRGNTNTLSRSTLEKIKHMISEGALLKDMANQVPDMMNDSKVVFQYAKISSVMNKSPITLHLK